MALWILTCIVYVFFVYGVIAFIKNVYSDMTDKNRHIGRRIEVFVEEGDDVEYIVRMLKKDFNSIILVTRDDREELRNLVQGITLEGEIEYRVLDQGVNEVKY